MNSEVTPEQYLDIILITNIECVLEASLYWTETGNPVETPDDMKKAHAYLNSRPELKRKLSRYVMAGVINIKNSLEVKDVKEKE